MEESNLQIPESSTVICDLKTAFLFSDFIFSNLTRNPLLFKELLVTNCLYRAYPTGSYARDLSHILQNASDEKQIAEKTSHFRCREMIRIAFRDLTGYADLSETMSDLSALADACIVGVFSKLYD